MLTCEIPSTSTTLAGASNFNTATTNRSGMTTGTNKQFVMGTATRPYSTRAKQKRATRSFFARALVLGFTSASPTGKEDKQTKVEIKDVDSGKTTVSNSMRNRGIIIRDSTHIAACILRQPNLIMNIIDDCFVISKKIAPKIMTYDDCTRTSRQSVGKKLAGEVA